MSDDPATLERFAAEVAPTLREAVAAERSAARAVPATPPGAIGSGLLRAGVAYDAIPTALVGTAVRPADAGYARVRSTFIRPGSPALVLRPGSPAEVADAIAFARTQAVDLSIRSGGHGISGRSTNHGGIVVDLSALNAIEVLDQPTRRVRIGPGCALE